MENGTIDSFPQAEYDSKIIEASEMNTWMQKMDPLDSIGQIGYAGPLERKAPHPNTTEESGDFGAGEQLTSTSSFSS